MFIYFMAGFIIFSTGLIEQLSMTSLLTMYSSLGSSLTGYRSSKMTIDDGSVKELSLHVKQLKYLVNAMWDESPESSLYSLKFHLLIRVVNVL